MRRRFARTAALGLVAIIGSGVGPVGAADAVSRADRLVVEAASGLPAGVLPIGIPYVRHTCDEANEPVAGDRPWPSGELVIIPLCEPDPGGVAWIDWTPPSGSTAELIATVDAPIATVPVPSWQYVVASGRVHSGNLEFSLDEQAGLTLQVLVVDATCSEPPATPTDGCSGDAGTAASSWARALTLRTFTLTSAHLTQDLEACGAAHPETGCLIGTFGPYAPPTPFTDIGSSPFGQHIAWAYESGITLGCGADLFCPAAPVTRAQLASFLDRMFDPPDTVLDFFADDTDSTHEAAINRIAAAGITQGCADAAYCPGTVVTREQMASFIARAAGLPAVAANPFYDDDFRTHEAAINRAAAAGITTGCAAYRYCPVGAVTREQMVAFLHRVVAPAVPPPAQAPCDRAYTPSLCIPSPPPYLDCEDVPHTGFAVRPPDPHEFDPDIDGIGCEQGH